MKASIRNRFPATVRAVKPGVVSDEIELQTAGGARIVATITPESRQALGLTPGKAACVLLTASSIMLVAAPASARLSARNQLEGKVAQIVSGDLNSEVVIALAGGDALAAIVANDSVAQLALAVGSNATAVFKASSVVVGVSG